MKPDQETKLYQIAETQLGYFTSKQASLAGYSAVNHPYHVNKGHWVREHRGIYRLANFPQSPEGEFVLWSLWSRNQSDIPQGVYSHETALSLYEVSDVLPAKLHMTVPKQFRKAGNRPTFLVLHRADLTIDEIQKKTGFSVTTPFKTVTDLLAEGVLSEDIIKQALKEFFQQGLLTEKDTIKLVEKHPSLAKHIFRLAQIENRL